MAKSCTCGGCLQTVEHDNVVWDECQSCGAQWDQRVSSIADIRKHAAKLEMQTKLRDDAIRRVKQVVEIMRDIPVITQGDKEAVSDAKSMLRSVLRCIEDINGIDE